MVGLRLRNTRGKKRSRRYDKRQRQQQPDAGPPRNPYALNSSRRQRIVLAESFFFSAFSALKSSAFLA
jgi:hypothetical protein